MKRLLPMLVLVFLLQGCGNGTKPMDKAMDFRRQLLAGSGCSFTAIVTADYEDALYTFTMDCAGDKEGSLTFTVAEPETISGITGKLSHSGGSLTFDDQALAFPMMAEGQLTPVSAPYIFLKTLRGGYLKACGNDEDHLRLSIDDSYEENALHLDIWLDQQCLPVRGEIYWQGRRILSLEIKNFTIL